ncbi:DUF2520 domain-containing protein [bacterium]|nr:DUF2520 domain-containing protein [bacterium]
MSGSVEHQNRTSLGTLGLAGSGHLAWHWTALLSSQSASFDIHYHRSLLNTALWPAHGKADGPAGSGTQSTQSLEDLRHCEAVFLALSDRALGTFSASLSDYTGLRIHGSGGRSIEVLGTAEGQRNAVFYLPQTFTAGRRLDYSGLPVCIEASREEDAVLLEQFAFQLGLRPVRLYSAARAQLHLAAVFANNFVNLQFDLAERILAEHQLPTDLLHPLMQETLHKAWDLGPRQAQTGPARRGDLVTVRKHLKMLKNQRWKRIYRVLSDYLFEDGQAERSRSAPPHKDITEHVV